MKVLEIQHIYVCPYTSPCVPIPGYWSKPPRGGQRNASNETPIPLLALQLVDHLFFSGWRGHLAVGQPLQQSLHHHQQWAAGFLPSHTLLPVLDTTAQFPDWELQSKASWARCCHLLSTSPQEQQDNRLDRPWNWHSTVVFFFLPTSSYEEHMSWKWKIKRFWYTLNNVF